MSARHLVNLKEITAKEGGAVTALAISLDHTFIAAGHASGAIHIYSLQKASQPARSVQPTNLNLVLANKAEGHLEGSRIRHLSFVGTRHTAIVSSDDRGLAFYHSLGQVLGLANVDTVRIIGRYPDEEQPAPALPDPSPNVLLENNTLIGEAPVTTLKTKVAPLVFDLATLPLGTSPHATDAYGLVAIVTPTKLLVAGLKPTPRTWWRSLQKDDIDRSTSTTSKVVIGSLAWFPSSAPVSDSHKMGALDPAELKSPILAFSFGHIVRLVRVSVIAEQTIKIPSSLGGKHPNDVKKTLTFEESSRWAVEGMIIRLSWLNQRVRPATPYHLISDARLDSASANSNSY